MLDGFRIHATDGDIGHLEDFYFDDDHWTVRYVVVKTGPWLFGREVLLAPPSFTEVDWARRELKASLSRGQIRDAPGRDLARPISRAFESRLHRHYGVAPYWQAGGAWTGGLGPTGPGASYGMPQAGPIVLEEQLDSGDGPVDYHLRSSDELVGYRIETLDGELGHLDDFLLDDAAWKIPYLVVDARRRLRSSKILLATGWVEGTGFPVRRVRVCVQREAMLSAPAYDESRTVTPELEQELYTHFGKGSCRDRTA